MQRRRQPMQKSMFLAYFCALQNRVLDKPARSAIYAGLNFGEQGCRCEPSTDATTVRGGPRRSAAKAVVLSTPLTKLARKPSEPPRAPRCAASKLSII